MKQKTMTTVMSLALMASALMMVPMAAADQINSEPIHHVVHDHVYPAVNETLDAACALDPSGSKGGAICLVASTPGETTDWWNGEAYQWWRGWWCFGMMGGADSGHCQTYEGPTDPHACLEDKHLLTCEVPAILPEPPGP